MFSKEIHDKCGVGAVMASIEGEDVSAVAANIGYVQSNRGHEGAGLARKRLNGGFALHRGTERFAKVFPSMATLDANDLRGEIVIAHNRYRTTGASDDIDYAQPMLIQEFGRTLIGAHNGNIANAEELYHQLKREGTNFVTENKFDEYGNRLPVSDSEILFRKIARAEGVDWKEKVINGLKGVEGSFSFVIGTDTNDVIAGRDPWAVRPMSWGRLNGYFVIASETSVLDKMNVYDQEEIPKGELRIFRPNQMPESVVYDNTKKLSYCDLEDYYVSNPDSRRRNVEADLIREILGKELAREELESGRLVKYADYVCPVPDSGRSAAITFSEEVGIRYRERLYKERYSEIFDSSEEGARSFIASNEILNKRILDNKFRKSRDLEGKVIYLIDDTGIRLRTLKQLAIPLKNDLRVREIHVRYAAPKFLRPCVLGINIKSREELGAVKQIDGIWMKKSNEEIAEEMHVDSVGFLSMAGRARVREYFGESSQDFCGYCHGAEGPGFDMSKYDPDLLKEKNVVVQRMLTVV
jgi:amidophosphoribosyltransferase